MAKPDEDKDIPPQEQTVEAPAAPPEEVTSETSGIKFVTAESIHGNVKAGDVAARAAAADAQARLADPLVVVIREADPRIGGGSTDYGQPAE